MCHGHGGDWSCDRVDGGEGSGGESEEGEGGGGSRLFILCFYYSFLLWGGEGMGGREGIMYRWIKYANA